jgi:hypothetical protein
MLEGISDPSGASDEVAVAFMEVRVLESLTGRGLAKMVIHQGAQTQTSQAGKLTSEALYSAIDYWADLLRQQIDQIHNGNK